MIGRIAHGGAEHQGPEGKRAHRLARRDLDFANGVQRVGAIVKSLLGFAVRQ